MRTTVDPLHHGSRLDLLVLARDALRLAGRTASPGRATAGHDLIAPGRLVSLLAETLDALETVMDQTATQTQDAVEAGRIVAVDGIFVGDAREAAAVTALWLERAREALEEARPAVVNAHVAAGGLASA